VDDSGGRRRCGNDGQRGEVAALCGAANGGGGWRGNRGWRRAGWRAGVATKGGRGYCGRQLATGVWRAGGRRPWAGVWGGRTARVRGAGGRRPTGTLLLATGGRLSSDSGRAARWAWRRVGGSGGGCSVERKREERELLTSRAVISNNSRRPEYGADGS
jgi:hypothetical protein